VASHSAVIPGPASQPSPRLAKLFLLTLCLGAALLWFFSRFLFAANFLPHWYCYIGNTRLVWTNVLADLVIGISYVIISCTLALLVRRAGENLPYQSFFWAFGLFIVSCGATHFMEVLTIWKPVYWLSALVKVVTAVASAGTAVVLVIAAPEILRFVRTAREAAARVGNEKFRALVEASPLAVLSFDSKGLVTSWNASAEKTFGFTRSRPSDVPIPPFRRAHIGTSALLQKALAGEVIRGLKPCANARLVPDSRQRKRRAALC